MMSSSQEEDFLPIEEQNSSSSKLFTQVRESTAGSKPKFILSQKLDRQTLINKLSPECKLIYKKYLNAKKEISTVKRAQKALKFSMANTLEKLMNSMTSFDKKHMEKQINLICKKPKGKSFTMEEQLISLTILKRNPKEYRFLHKIFILPPNSTLNKLKLNVDVRVKSQFFSTMVDQVADWEDKKKYCTIILHEISLTPVLSYDKRRCEESNQFADHVLVFMLRGAVHKWQKPLAYYFFKGTMSGIHMKNILKDIVTTVAKAGLFPLALVSDQGSAFRSAIKRLRQEMRTQQIISDAKTLKTDHMVRVNDIPLCVIYDPYHLIKGIRNNFLTKNIVYDGKVATWQDIIRVYKSDSSGGEIRILKKLNDECVMPEKINKKKLSNCVRVFSRTMAAILGFTSTFSLDVDGKPISKTLETTAEVVLLFNQLFDSLNGAAELSNKSIRELRTAVTDESNHVKFWRQAIKKLGKIKFVDKNGKEVPVPTVQHWIVTIKSFWKLWRILKNKEVEIMRPRLLVQTRLKRFMGF